MPAAPSGVAGEGVADPLRERHRAVGGGGVLDDAGRRLADPGPPVLRRQPPEAALPGRHREAVPVVRPLEPHGDGGLRAAGVTPAGGGEQALDAGVRLEGPGDPGRSRVEQLRRKVGREQRVDAVPRRVGRAERRHPDSATRPRQLAPPGQRLAGSGRKKRTRDAESRSNPPAPTPSSAGSWASTTRTSTWLRSSSAASAVDWATITGERSPPTAEPVGPTARAIGSSAAPLPQPRSRARSPGWGSSSATSPFAIGWKKSTPTWS